MEKKLSEEMKSAAVYDSYNHWLDPDVIEQIKQLEEEAEYWRKLKALPTTFSLHHNHQETDMTPAWEIRQIFLDRKPPAQGVWNAGNTPEEALDAYYKEREE